MDQHKNSDALPSFRDENVDATGERSARARPTRYRMASDVAALDTDFLILNGAGEHVLRINRVALTDQNTIAIEDMDGQVLYRSPAHLARTLHRVSIYDAGGVEVGAVLRVPESPLRDRFAIELTEAPTMAIQGTPTSHEFSIVGPTGLVAEVSHRWFRARGSYGIEIAPNQLDALLITSVVVLDVMVHRGPSDSGV